MFNFISDKMSVIFRILNFDNKKYNNIKGNQNTIIQGDNNTLGFSSNVIARKQLINSVIICLEKLEDNKISEKACAPIIIDLENHLRELRVDLQSNEYSLHQLLGKLFKALNSTQYTSLQVRALFEAFDPNWQQLDKINFKSFFDSAM